MLYLEMPVQLMGGFEGGWPACSSCLLLLLLGRLPAPATAGTHPPACCRAPLPLRSPACLLHHYHLLLPQNHSNEDIYEKAVAILEAYFDVEDGEEENLAPAVAETGGVVVLLMCSKRRGFKGPPPPPGC